MSSKIPEPPATTGRFSLVYLSKAASNSDVPGIIIPAFAAPLAMSCAKPVPPKAAKAGLSFRLRSALGAVPIAVLAKICIVILFGSAMFVTKLKIPLGSPGNAGAYAGFDAAARVPMYARL